MDDKSWETDDSFKDIFRSKLSDEIDDAEYYVNVAKDFECKCEDKNIARGFYEIAKDEYTHACFIRECMMRECIDIPEATECRFKSVEAKIKHIFR